MRQISVLSIAAVSLAALALSACDDAPVEEKAEPVRAIKPYYVSEPAGGEVRRYSGTVAATLTSSLGFAVNGTVATVNVVQGDRVSSGDVLATLDPEPFQLDVSAAQAELDAKQAEVDQAREELGRQKDLYKKGWVSKAGYEKAVAAYDTTAEGLNLSRSRLGIAERELAKASLLAPFDGVIAERNIEPFIEVSRGETVLRIDSEGTMEIEFSVSDSVVDRLSVGATISIEASSVNGCGCEGRVSEIGSQASAANVVPVTAVVTKSNAGLIPGMGVEVGVKLSDTSNNQGYLVPLVAIAPGDEQARGYVFKFDADAGVVRKVPVTGGGGVNGNFVGLSEGVQAGDIVAAAGISFLRDGQPVKLMDQQ